MNDVPGILAEIARLVGDDAAERLAVARGGQTLHVPGARTLTETHDLVKILGERRAHMISAAYAGESLYIPRARKWVAMRMFDRGASANYVATRLGLSISAARTYRRLSQPAP